MRIGGLQKLSLIDFPGRVSCVLFLSGCNFHCPYCHNPALARGTSDPHAPGIDDFLSFAAERRRLIDGVVISGGEPTLQAALPDLCAAIRDLGLAVKLDTNGSRPGMLRRLLTQGLVDSVALDLKTDPAAYAPVICEPGAADGVAESLRLLRDSGLPVEFRTTLAPPPLVDEAILARLAQRLGPRARYALQTCRFEAMLDPAFLAACSAPPYSPAQRAALLAAIRPLVGEALLR
jgi:pyruvate formate lyase activating enzyme